MIASSVSFRARRRLHCLIPSQVSARGAAEYSIEFVPLVMTSLSPVVPGSEPAVWEDDSVGDDGRPFRLKGTLFFALPDGRAVLYKLQGVAEGPGASSSVALESPAKTALTFTVPVSNWLRRPQR